MSSNQFPVQPLPEQFTRTIHGLYGDQGVDWLDRLPILIATFERRWSITVLPPFQNLSYNYLAPALSPGGCRELVLKLGVPNPELQTEIEALACFQGRGCVQLLAADREQGALLLDRLQPGMPLSALDDDQQATSIAAGVMRRLWRPLWPDHPFPSVANWAAGLGRLRKHFDGATGPLPEDLVSRAECLFNELLDSMAEPVLLHGDLHHDNILAVDNQPWRDAGRRVWLAIDPKGLAGEPAYEVGALLRNPWPKLLSMPQPDRILARRVDQLSAELGFERERIVGWGLAQAVLSAWWCIEDNVPCWEYAIACAELLAAL
jgi:streptomycin 6-kinase